MGFRDTRVVIIGAGNVGSTTAYTIINQELCEEVVLIDMNKDKALGEVMDMQHSIYFMNRNMKVRCGEYEDCRDADVVIITASAPMDKNATDRLSMFAPTKKVMKSIVDSVMASGFNGILLVVSNPVDIMTYYAWKLSGLPANQVIGSGTTLDMARLCTRISELFSLDSKSVSAYIIGEHGDSEVVSWNSATIGGKNLADVMADNADRAQNETYEKLKAETTAAGWDIFHRKGNTSYGIAASVTAILKSIMFNENRILPVTTYLNGQYGLDGLFISVPTIIGKDGAKEIVEIKLTPEESKALKESADIVSSYYNCFED